MCYSYYMNNKNNSAVNYFFCYSVTILKNKPQSESAYGVTFSSSLFIHSTCRKTMCLVLLSCGKRTACAAIRKSDGWNFLWPSGTGYLCKWQMPGETFQREHLQFEEGQRELGVSFIVLQKALNSESENLGYVLIPLL